MVLCKNAKRYRHLFDASRQLFFFGAPHRGMRTQELEAMVHDAGGGEASKNRLIGLREDSELLEHLREFLADSWGHFEVVSFYEIEDTHTVKKVDILRTGSSA